MGIDLQIGSTIKALREKGGLNIREFAEQIGSFTPDYLAKIERGDVKEPKYEHLIAIAHYCDVTIDYILTGIGIPINQNMNLYTEPAKEALRHLDKCARSIKQLDSHAFDLLSKLENELNLYEDPEITKTLHAIQPQNSARN